MIESGSSAIGSGPFASPIIVSQAIGTMFGRLFRDRQGGFFFFLEKVRGSVGGERDAAIGGIGEAKGAVWEFLVASWWPREGKLFYYCLLVAALGARPCGQCEKGGWTLIGFGAEAG